MIFFSYFKQFLLPKSLLIIFDIVIILTEINERKKEKSMKHLFLTLKTI